MRTEGRLHVSQGKHREGEEAAGEQSPGEASLGREESGGTRLGALQPPDPAPGLPQARLPTWQPPGYITPQASALGDLMDFESAQVGSGTSLPPCFLHPPPPGFGCHSGPLRPPSPPGPTAHLILPACSHSFFPVSCQVLPGSLPPVLSGASGGPCL